MNVMLLSGRPYSVDIALLRSVSPMEAMVVVDWLVCLCIIWLVLGSRRCGTGSMNGKST